MKTLLMELECLAQVIAIIQRHLYGDELTDDRVMSSRKVVLEEASLLFNLYLDPFNEHDPTVDYTYMDECGYFQECEPFFQEVLNTHLWKIHTPLINHRQAIRFINPGGLIAIDIRFNKGRQS